MAARAAEGFGFDSEALLGSTKPRALSRARQAATWALKKRWPELSYPQLAALTGRTDHSTAIYNFRQAELWRTRCQFFYDLTEALLADHPLPERLALSEEAIAEVLAEWAAAAGEDRPTREQRRDELVGEAHFGGTALGSARLLQALRRAHPERFTERTAA